MHWTSCLCLLNQASWTRMRDLNARARGELQAVLELAVEIKADEATLEWCAEGLEVAYRCGDTGFGRVIGDREKAQAILGLIVDGADLSRKMSGILKWKILK